ncbi:MAG: molybdopterin-synthase adenylyltransferase MoeB [Alphaproteobacteria bacterium]
MVELTDAQFERYARHLILDEVGEAGQARLLGARVALIGAGGLGAPAALYLAAAGIGRLTLIDDDAVELSNLQRQVIHATAMVGRPKTESAAATLAAVNPDIAVAQDRRRLTADNAADLLAGHDVVLDGSDNFATRYAANDACFRLGIPLVSGALLRFEAQVGLFQAHLGPPHPCYRCLFPAPPPADLVPRCDQAGILGAVAGVAGTIMAVETLKLLLGLGDDLSGRLLLYDALGPTFTTMRAGRDPQCSLCAGAGAGPVSSPAA